MAVVTVDSQSSGLPIQVAQVTNVGGLARSTPTVTAFAGVSPDNQPANLTSLSIVGTNFDTTAANDLVILSDGAVGTVHTSASHAPTATTLYVDITTAPVTAGVLTATVVVDGVSSAASSAATIQPVVTQNTTNPVGITATTLTINGYGFDPTASRDAVAFTNSLGAADGVGTVTSATPTSLTVSFTGTGDSKPTFEGILNAKVTVTESTIGYPSTATQVATVVPVVTAVTSVTYPINAAPVVTINGFGFTGATAVTLKDAAGVALTVSGFSVNTLPAAAAGTIITATCSTLPTVLGALTAVIANSGNSAAVQVGTVVPAVNTNLASLADTATIITIGGHGFDPTHANNTVAFNDGAAGVVVGSTSTSLLVQFTTRPTTAGSLTATVTTDGISSSSTQVATVAPVVTPATTSMPVNTADSITINGYGFSTTAASDSVSFDGGATWLSPTAATANAFTVSYTPTSTGNLTAIVKVGPSGSQVSSGSAVQVGKVVPAVTSSTTALAASVTAVTIAGHGFDSAAANNAVSFSYSSSGTASWAGVITAATATSLTVGFNGQNLVAGPLYASVTSDGLSSSWTQVAAITPVITANTATLGGHQYVIISGYGFDTTTLTKDVFKLSSGTAGVNVFVSATSIEVPLTVMPTVWPLTASVTLNGQTSNTVEVASGT